MSPVNLSVALVCLMVAAVCGCETQQQQTQVETPVTPVAPAPPSAFDEAVAHEQRGELELAVWKYQQAIRENPKDSRAHVNLGRLYAREGQVERAERHWRHAIELNPNDARAYNLLGGAHMRRQEYDEAIACYQRALEADPRYANAHWNMATACRHQGMTEAAARHYRRYIALASPEEREDIAEARSYLLSVGER